jgi:ribonucleotide reductase beta subunit family protein with ferritin-like domain
MFRTLIIFAFTLIFSEALAQNTSPGHYCRMGKTHQSTVALTASAVQDSIHIQHYDISIDSLNFSQKKL